ncbi:uncharacterized protein [Venturia canescens]|uniref:uncharacterized protein isoform X2 n=1 Tax=Venturia canescens TaxID=32260 RepID=UPI001C9BF7B0|nr:uncharacterized protein LOC122410761 isoform X2 [Venturia canescens]
MKVEGWIRCNKCYKRFRDSTQTFTVTQCKHVFCECCVSLAGVTNCQECATVDVQTMILERPLKRTPLAPFCRFLTEILEEAEWAAEFQRSQALIALRRYDEIEKKYKRLKEMYIQSEKERKMWGQHRTKRHDQLDSIIRELGREMYHYHMYKSKRLENRSTDEFASHEMEQDTISRRTNNERNRPLQSLPVLGDQRSNRYHHGSICPFTPFTYSPRVVISGGSSKTSNS